MDNEPFRFLEKQARIDELCELLRAAGFGLIERSGLSLTFARDGAAPVVITWELAWWPDGVLQEDDRITIRQGDEIIAEIDVGKMLRSKLPRPLAEEISRRVAQVCEAASPRAAL